MHRNHRNFKANKHTVIIFIVLELVEDGVLESVERVESGRFRLEFGGEYDAITDELTGCHSDVLRLQGACVSLLLSHV